MRKKIDLHGYKHAEAKEAVIRLIEESYNKNTLVTAITGNSSKMRNVVIEVLSEYDITPLSTFLETEVKFYT